MNPLITDWMQTWASIIMGVLGITGIVFTLIQIYQVKLQIKNSALINILTLKADMNKGKEKVDDINMDIMKAEKMQLVIKLSDDQMQMVKDVYEKYLDNAIENWLYSINRWCFCIKNKYIKEKDWKAEYRDYIAEVVKTYEGKFGPATKYKSIKEIYDKWSRE